MINFNPNMDKINHMLSKVWDKTIHSQPAAVEIWELIGNFILNIIIGAIIYKCWD